MQFITIAKTVISLIPLIIQAITAIEAAFPQGGTGAAKLEVVKSALKTASDVSSDLVGNFDAYWPVIEKVISSVVSLANSSGVFKKP